MNLLNKRVAILVADGFEQIELEAPLQALEKEGALVSIISPSRNKVQGMNYTELGDAFEVDIQLDEANSDDFDALVMPGGLINPDTLRVNRRAIEFIRGFIKAGKPISAICHAPLVLIETGLVSTRRLTSFPAIKTDVINAGGEWVDETVVVDNGLITSRTIADIPAFNRETIRAIAEFHIHAEPALLAA